MNIGDRKKQILRGIVALYALEGEPVGSNLLGEYLNLAVSSATLRNEMAELTKLGFLAQPHTSAGRVPSSAGFRYYLDYLMKDFIPLNPQEKTMIDSIFENLDYDPNTLAQGTAKALSEFLGYTVIATTPKADDIRIAHFDIMQVGKYTACITAVTSAGGVLTRVAKTQIPLTQNMQEVLSTLLNRALCFISAHDVSNATLLGIARALGPQSSDVFSIVNAAVSLLNQAGQPHTYIEGIKYLVSYPEISNCLVQALELFQDNEKTQQLIIPQTDDVCVILGEDIINTPLQGLSIMTRRYLAGGGLSGAIAIVGPERMPYKSMVPTLEYFALNLGQIMSGNI